MPLRSFAACRQRGSRGEGPGTYRPKQETPRIMVLVSGPAKRESEVHVSFFLFISGACNKASFSSWRTLFLESLTAYRILSVSVGVQARSVTSMLRELFVHIYRTSTVQGASLPTRACTLLSKRIAAVRPILWLLHSTHWVAPTYVNATPKGTEIPRTSLPLDASKTGSVLFRPHFPALPLRSSCSRPQPAAHAGETRASSWLDEGQRARACSLGGGYVFFLNWGSLCRTGGPYCELVEKLT